MFKKSLIFLLILSLALPSIGGLMTSAQTQEISAGGAVSAVGGSEEYFEYSMKQYDELSQSGAYDDPMEVTDEELFGVWSEEAGEWITQPLLDYDNYEELSEIERFAKSGDYTTAKYAYLQYAKKKFSNNKMTAGKSTEYVDLLRARLYFENFYDSNTGLDIMSVGENPDWTTATVTSAVQAAATATSKKVSFCLLALKRDGYMAVFDSKEGENIPYVSVEIDGRTHTFYPVVDAMVQAGMHKDENFGTEPVFLVEESYSAMGSQADARTDSYTKRASLVFDFSSVDETASIRNARLHLYGNMLESDNPKRPGEEKNFKDIVVCTGSDVEFTDTDRTWFSSTDMENIRCFDGEAGMFGNRAIYDLRISKTLTKAYNGTKNEAYMWHALRLEINRMKYHLQCGLGSIATLNSSEIGYDNPVYIADMVRSESITPEQWTIIAKYMYLNANYLVNDGWGTAEAAANFGTANSGALIIDSVVFSEFRKAREPLIKTGAASQGYRGGWLAVGQHRQNWLAQNLLFEDGACVEVALSYAQYNINLLQRPIIRIQDMGLDPREYLSAETLDILEKFLLYLVYISNPVGGGWMQGDEGEAYMDANLSVYTKLYRFYENPVLEWGRNPRGTRGKEPDFTSISFDYAKKAVLRPNWNENSVAAFINADAGQKSHGGVDDLAFDLYAYGDYLLVDTGRGANYDQTRPEIAFLYTSKGHNTITINGENQSGSEMGDMHPEDREFNDAYNFMKVEAKTYGDFKVIRDVLFLSPTYFILTDYINPPDENINTYELTWHAKPNKELYVNENTLMFKTISPKADVIVSPVVQDAGMSYKKESGWYTTMPADYITYETDKAGIATFNTVIYPEKANEDISITTQNIDLDVEESVANAFRFDMTEAINGIQKSGYYYTLLDKTRKEQRDFEKYSTDSTLAFVEETEGNYNRAVIRNGSNIKNKENGQYLLKSESTIGELGVTWNGATIELNSSKNCYYGNGLRSGYDESERNYAYNADGNSSVNFVDYPVSNAFDADLSTACMFAYEQQENPDTNPWLEANIGDAKSVSQITVVDDKELVDYDIYYSNDTTQWTPCEIKNKQISPDNSTGKTTKIYTIKTVEARCFKIVAKNGENIAVYEYEVNSSAGAAIALYDLSIYAPSSVRKITYNGESLSFVRSGDYITFKEENSGTDQGTETITPGGDSSSGNSPSQNDNPNHGGGGLAGGGGGSGNNTPEVVPIQPEKPSNLFSSELEDHWGKNEIEDMINRGIVEGDGKSLNLTLGVSRAEFAAVLVRALNLELKEYENEFHDVDKDDWHAKYIATVKAIGIMEGSEGNALPDDIITRQQMAKMLTKAYRYLNSDVQIKGVSDDYEDYNDISLWAREFVDEATELGLLKGVGNNQFRPLDYVLREQAFVAVYRLIKDMV